MFFDLLDFVKSIANRLQGRLEAHRGTVTLIQRFGSAANLNIHLRCLVLDGVYWRTDGGPVFVQADSPTEEELQALLHRIITRLMKLLTRRSVLVEEEEGGDRAIWRTPRPIRMRPARSGRYRRPRVPTALPLVRAVRCCPGCRRTAAA